MGFSVVANPDARQKCPNPGSSAWRLRNCFHRTGTTRQNARAYPPSPQGPVVGRSQHLLTLNQQGVWGLGGRSRPQYPLGWIQHQAASSWRPPALVVLANFDFIHPPFGNFISRVPVWPLHGFLGCGQPRRPTKVSKSRQVNMPSYV